MTNHTLVPWHTESNQITMNIKSGHLQVCHVDGILTDTEANAELICRAVNSHDALVEALERWIKYAADNEYSVDPTSPSYCSFLKDGLDALIAAKVS